jgi:small Trp-rich protein
VVLCFVIAAAWWQFSDAMGITQRSAMRRVEEKAAQRRQELLANLGLRRSSGDASRDKAARKR